VSEIARLREAIQARKFRKMELAGEIDRKLREIKDLLAGYPLAKIPELKLHLIAQLAAEAAALQDKYTGLQREIELAEKELG
jgi:hypothetical protein